MSRSVRWVAAVAVVGLIAACGNSEGGGSGPEPDEGDDAVTGPAGEAERDTFVALDGVPGVTDDEISYAVIGTSSNNPLGTCILDCYVEGIEAYFAFRNSEGGIYGRDLVVGEVLDDELGQNQVRALEVISADDAFGAFQATLLATGWGDLDDAGIPTYTWGIHATEAANRDAHLPEHRRSAAPTAPAARSRYAAEHGGRHQGRRRSATASPRTPRSAPRPTADVDRALRRGHRRRGRLHQRRARPSACPTASAPRSPP